MTVYNGTCGDSVTWTHDTDTGVLEFSGSGEIPDYNQKESPWYDHCATITHVIINSGITSIGAYAFYQHYALTSVDLPEGLTTIGIGAFQGSSSIKEIVFPKTLTWVKGSAFRGCNSLNSITFKGNQPTLDSGSFSLGMMSSMTGRATVYSKGWASSDVFTQTVIGSYTTLTYVKVGVTVHVNVGGTWKEAVPYVNVGGTWKEVTSVHVNVNGTWKEVS